MKPSTRVALCVRTASSADQNGVAQRIKQLQKSCKEKDKVVAETYVDQGFNGRDLDRPSLQRLLADAKEGLFDEVFVTDMGQLSCNVANLDNIYQILAQRGVNFTSVFPSFDSSSPECKFGLSLMAAIVKLEKNFAEERLNADA